MRSGMCHMHSFLKSGKQAWGQVLATCAASQVLDAGATSGACMSMNAGSSEAPAAGQQAKR